MRCVIAAMLFCFAVPVGAMTSGSPAFHELGLAFKNLTLWLNTDAGRQFLTLDPSLSQLSSLDYRQETGRWTIDLLAQHLPADFHLRLSDIASLSVEQQQETIATLAAARRTAANSMDTKMPRAEAMVKHFALDQRIPDVDGHLRLGVLSQSIETLNGKTFTLINDFHYLSFSAIGNNNIGLGKPAINEQPGIESKLELKHVVREIPGRPDQEFRHDYSFLALGATPPGRYDIVFPEIPRISFTIEVSPKDKIEIPAEERLKAAQKSTQKTVREIWSKPDPVIPFGPKVSGQVQGFMKFHYPHMSKYIEWYQKYLQEDPVINDAIRTTKTAGIEALKKIYEEIISGKNPHRTLDPLVAQLLSREKPVLEDYKQYFLADPSHGRAFTELHLEQMEHYEAALRKLREVYSQIGETRPFSLLGWIAGKATVAWFRIRYTLAMTPSQAQVETPEPGLSFADNVPYENRDFLSAVHGFLEPLGNQLEKYVKNDAAIDESTRTSKLKTLAYLREFMDKRVAGEGLRWSQPSMATHIWASGWQKLSPDYKSYVRQDVRLGFWTVRSRINLAEKFESLLKKSLQIQP